LSHNPFSGLTRRSVTGKSGKGLRRLRVHFRKVHSEKGGEREINKRGNRGKILGFGLAEAAKGKEKTTQFVRCAKSRNRKKEKKEESKEKTRIRKVHQSIWFFNPGARYYDERRDFNWRQDLKHKGTREDAER